MLQDSTRISSLFPPLFSSIFTRKVVGVVTKVDVDGGNVERAERFLKNAGAREIIRSSSITGVGLDILKEMLQ